MSRLILDTSAYSAFKRNHADVVRHLRRAQEILVPTIVLGELLGGFAAGGRARRNRDELRVFFESPRVRLVAITGETAERYAVIYASLRASGNPIPTNDLWIAASAMEHGTELLTLDRDFRHVAQILVAWFEPQKAPGNYGCDFTAGPDECRAWPIPRGTPAPRAAGKIHCDIERGFIRAEVIPWQELATRGSEAQCREAGVLRVEGRDYVIQDGDVVNFRFNV